MPRNRKLPAGAALTVELLSAYLANNTVATQDVPDLIRSIRMALTEAQAPALGGLIFPVSLPRFLSARARPRQSTPPGSERMLQRGGSTAVKLRKSWHTRWLSPLPPMSAHRRRMKSAPQRM
jgi:hypothetical protein